jgi:hypothetical protein
MTVMSVTFVTLRVSNGFLRDGPYEGVLAAVTNTAGPTPFGVSCYPSTVYNVE